MLKIAITGGIASGKTTFCKNLEKLGYKVFYSDSIAKLLCYNACVIKDIIELFGENAYLDGVYNAPFIASIVFTDKVKLEQLNNIFSNLIIDEFELFCEAYSDEPCVFFESALVFEHNLVDTFDIIVCTFTPIEEVKIRLKERNNFTNDEIEMRLKNQLNPVVKKVISDYIIETEEDAYHFIEYLNYKLELHNEQIT